jgi:hypothetical protein
MSSPSFETLVECVKRRLDSAITVSGDAAHAPPRSDGLFFFDGHFGRLKDRKNGIALFEIHSCTEPVVVIDVRLPAAVRITTSDTTLSEVIFSIVPGNLFRILVLIVVVRL